MFASQGYLELLMAEPCFECTRLDAQWLCVFKTCVFFTKSEGFLVIHLVFLWSSVRQAVELLPADRRKGHRAHRKYPCRTDQWCILPSAHCGQWPLQRALEETVDIPSQFYPSDGQYYTVGTSSASQPALSHMPRQKVNDAWKDPNRSGSSKYQYSSFLYCMDLHLSTDQSHFCNFLEVLSRSTKILMLGCTVTAMCSHFPSVLWRALSLFFSG